MNIEIVEEIPLGELEKRVREVPLLKTREVFPYSKASIHLRRIGTHELNPTTFYLLKKNLAFQEQLRKALFEGHGIDSLNLDMGYKLRFPNNQIWGLIPPIVEVVACQVRFVPQQGELVHNANVFAKVPVINDGAHRVFLAHKMSRPVTVLYISDVDPKHPFYAYPNHWSEVKIVDEVPQNVEEKKRHRRADSHFLYRDFGVLGCGGPRTPPQQTLRTQV